MGMVFLEPIFDSRSVNIKVFDSHRKLLGIFLFILPIVVTCHTAFHLDAECESTGYEFRCTTFGIPFIFKRSPTDANGRIFVMAFFHWVWMSFRKSRNIVAEEKKFVLMAHSQFHRRTKTGIKAE